MQKKGNSCQLFPFQDQVHGFFNVRNGDDTNFKFTLEKTDRFLTSLGYINGEPTIE